MRARPVSGPGGMGELKIIPIEICPFVSNCSLLPAAVSSNAETPEAGQIGSAREGVLGDRIVWAEFRFGTKV